MRQTGVLVRSRPSFRPCWSRPHSSRRPRRPAPRAPASTPSTSTTSTSSDTTEGTVSTGLLTFTGVNWATPQFVTVTGVDDPLIDGDIAYTIVLAPATSADNAFNGFNSRDVSAVNVNDDLPPLPKKVWGNCGLAGVEVLGPLGLLWLARRRRRRA